MYPKLVIFDMDGTVLDTLGDLLGAMNHAMEVFGFKKHTLSEMQSYVGNGLYMMAARAVPEGTDKAVTDEVFKCFKEYYASHLNIETRPYPGVTEMLGRLKDRGILTAISSNKFDPGARALAEYHFGALIDMTVGESELVPKKPDPTGTLLIMKTLGVSPEDTLYIGDSGVDIETARAAGLRMIAVSWGFRSADQLRQGGADTIVNSMEELERKILY